MTIKHLCDSKRIIKVQNSSNEQEWNYWSKPFKVTIFKIEVSSIWLYQSKPVKRDEKPKQFLV